jgi:hypothetical protein
MSNNNTHGNHLPISEMDNGRISCAIEINELGGIEMSALIPITVG